MEGIFWREMKRLRKLKATAPEQMWKKALKISSQWNKLQEEGLVEINDVGKEEEKTENEGKRKR